MLFSSIAIAQEYDNTERKDQKPVKETIKIPEFKPAIRFNFKLPNSVGNKSFQKVFNGLSNLEVTYMFPFAKNLFVTAGIQHYYYDINRFSFPEVSNGNLHAAFVVGEFGYQKFLNERWHILFSERVGYGYLRIKSDNCTAANEPSPSTALLMNETLVGLYLQGNERMTYGLLLSHQIHHFHFGPQWLCRETFSGLSPNDYVGYANSWSLGFGFTCLLGKIE